MRLTFSINLHCEPCGLVVLFICLCLLRVDLLSVNIFQHLHSSHMQLHILTLGIFLMQTVFYYHAERKMWGTWNKSIKCDWALVYSLWDTNPNKNKMVSARSVLRRESKTRHSGKHRPVSWHSNCNIVKLHCWQLQGMAKQLLQPQLHVNKFYFVMRLGPFYISKHVTWNALQWYFVKLKKGRHGFIVYFAG